MRCLAVGFVDAADPFRDNAIESLLVYGGNYCLSITTIKPARLHIVHATPTLAL